jgi:hypothetical protein
MKNATEAITNRINPENFDVLIDTIHEVEDRLLSSSFEPNGNEEKICREELHRAFIRLAEHNPNQAIAATSASKILSRSHHRYSVVNWLVEEARVQIRKMEYEDLRNSQFEMCEIADHLKYAARHYCEIESQERLDVLKAWSEIVHLWNKQDPEHTQAYVQNIVYLDSLSLYDKDDAEIIKTVEQVQKTMKNEPRNTRLDSRIADPDVVMCHDKL